MSLVSILEAGRRDFLDATRGVSRQQAATKPPDEGWSVLECIEHVVTVEKRYLGWIASGTVIEPRRDAEREMRLFTAIRNRLTKIETPEALRPRGRFATLLAALAEFNAVRDQSVRVAEERGDAIYAIGAKHPHFGNMNGAELLQLVDGHARRHADQIREASEPAVRPNIASKAVRAKRQFAFKRDRPDLPGRLESSVEADELLADGESIRIEGKQIGNLDRNGLRAGTFFMEGSVLDHVQLAGGEFGSAVWKDVRLVGCDLANMRARRMVLVRVEFIDCRLTGFRGNGVDWKDVLLQNGDGRYAQFEGGTLQSCEFDGCNLQEADFQNADLSGSVLRSCDLARTDFRGGKLRNTDFRGSAVEDMIAGMGDLRGAIVDPAQAMILARLMGLQIR